MFEMWQRNKIVMKNSQNLLFLRWQLNRIGMKNHQCIIIKVSWWRGIDVENGWYVQRQFAGETSWTNFEPWLPLLTQLEQLCNGVRLRPPHRAFLLRQKHSRSQLRCIWLGRKFLGAHLDWMWGELDPREQQQFWKAGRPEKLAAPLQPRSLLKVPFFLCIFVCVCDFSYLLSFYN